MVESVELALVISDLGSGGAQRVLTTLANAWAVKGRRICVITLADETRDFFPLNPAVQRLIAGGMHDSQNPLEAIWMNARRIGNLRRCLRESGAPVVVSFVGTTNLLTLFASVGLGIRVIISERNDPARQSLGRFWDTLRRWCYRWANRVTANSRGVLDTLSEFVPANKLAYVPNPIAIPAEMGKEALRPHSVLAVGRLHHQKAYDILLSAFARAASNLPDWRLEILGEGPLWDALHRQAEDLQISNRITWHGRAQNAFLFYRNAEIFVLASRHEGMPNAMLEAMVCGLPPIVTDASPGPLEYVEEGVSGLVVPAEDIPALEMALRRLMSDDELRHRLGRQARERLRDCELSKAMVIWEQVIGLRQ